MALDSIAATSLIGHRPMINSRVPSTVFKGKKFIVDSPSLVKLRVDRLANCSVRALAMGLTKEVHSFRNEKIPRIWNYRDDTDLDQKPGTWPPENKADNPAIHNPLLRQERMGCGWLGAIFEWEGVLVEDNPDLENQSWEVLAQEEGKSPPPAFMLKRIEGMKNEQAISEVLCWSRDPSQVKRMASRREDIYQALQGGIYRLRTGSQEFVNVLMNYNIPMALVSTRPRKTLESAIESIGIEEYFTAIVASDDVHRGKPDPEMFLYAGQLLKFIPERCIVFGNSNQTVEAAHDAKMKCVAVASKHPVYELGAADLVVRHLDELTVVDLKKLAAVESAEFQMEPEMELEEEYDDRSPGSVAVDDDFW
ncbi:hypothetical protein ACFE04_006424 [Oxalis oulophora]